MPLSLILTIAFFSFAASALSYFFAKYRLFSCLLLLFYISNTILSSSLLYNRFFVLFCILTAICVAFPIMCLILFALDTRYGLFCTDSSFAIVLVWLLAPVLFIINLIAYLTQQCWTWMAWTNPVCPCLFV